MKPMFGRILGLTLAAIPLASFAQPLPPAVRLEEIGPCVWSYLDPQSQAQLVAAFDASVEQYARASNAIGPRLTTALPRCWSPTPENQFAASYIAGMGLTQEVLARLIARDESVGRVQLDAAIAQVTPALRDQLMRTARGMYNGQRTPPPSMTPIFQALGLSVEPGYVNSPRGRRVTTYIGQSFQILVAANEPAPTNRKQVVELRDMGRCVWDQLTPEEKAPFVEATAVGNTPAFTAAENALARRSFALAIDCTPSIVADQTTAGRIMSLSLRREANAALIARELVISRTRLDETLAAAPPTLTASLQQTAVAMVRQQPPPPPQSIDGLFEALGQPATPEFRGSKPAQWITTYYLYTYAVRVLATQFGTSAPQPAAPAPTAPAAPSP